MIFSILPKGLGKEIIIYHATLFILSTEMLSRAKLVEHILVYQVKIFMVKRHLKKLTIKF